MMDERRTGDRRRKIEDDERGRRQDCPLTDEQYIEEIAEKAAEKAIEKLTSHVYQEVGKSVVSKLFYLVGACAFGIWLWLKAKGVIS